MPKTKKLVVGLVGDVCTGKSSIANVFENLGAQVFRADKAVHEIYRDDEVKAEVKAIFGDQVFDANGEVIRKELGNIVFNDPAKLAKLTDKIIFPRTGELLKKELEKFHANKGTKSEAPTLLLFDAPTLFESGRTDVCDKVIFATASLERRAKWAQENRGWDAKELKRRDEKLGDREKKIKQCDEVVENNGTLEELKQKIVQLVKKWQQEK